MPSSKIQLALLFACIALPALAHSMSALWPAARYAGGFEPFTDNDFEKREAFIATGGQQKRASAAFMPDYVDIAPMMLAGAKERRAPFSAEEDRWMKAMDNLRKPRFG